MMANKLLLSTLLLCLLGGCASSTSKPAGANDPCATIGQILEAYENQFADIRGQKRSYDRITIWTSTLQLVGSGCEIWGWQGGKYNYVCNYTAPDEATARDIYANAVKKIEACAGPEWVQKETDTQQQGGQQMLWQRQGTPQMVDLKLVPTRGINKPRWSLYLLLGDHNPQL